jgi:sugar (pentulose or hexulose) kinase
MNLTIDVGTTNTKVSLWSSVSATAPVEQKKFRTPKIVNGDLVDFDADSLFDDIANSIGDFSAEERGMVTKISIASVGESGVLINQEGTRVSSMVAWYDNRAQPIIDSLSEEDCRTIYSVCGIPPHAHYSAGKIRWLLDNEVDANESYTWLCIPDFIAYKFTGIMATEYSIASRTMCYDLTNRRWSSRVRGIFGIENVSFPDVHPAGYPIGKIKPEIADELHINSDVYLTIAGHDHMVGSFSSGQKSDELLDSTGTTEGVLLLTSNLNINVADKDSGIAYGIYQNPKLYTMFTALPSVGSVIEWFMKTYRLTEEEFMKAADIANEQYQGGYFTKNNINFVIPHFSGSGSPVKSTNTRGLWYGVTNQTAISDLVFGLFLGLTFELKHALESLHGTSISRIKLIGPATKDPLWIQLRADMISVPVLAMETPEAVSRGANIVAEMTIDDATRPVNPPNNLYTPSTASNIVQELDDVYNNAYKPLYKTKIAFEV